MADNVINTNTGVIEKAMATAISVQPSPLREISNKDYQGAFEEKVNGWAKGDTLTIAKDAIYDALDGFVDGTDITGKEQSFVEEKFEVTVNSNPLLPVAFTDAEVTFELDKNSMKGVKRLTKPVGDALKRKSDVNAAKFYNIGADNVLFYDVAPASFKNVFGEMKIRLVEAGLVGQLTAIIDERMEVVLARELEEKFAPVKKVEAAYRGEFKSYNSINFTNTQDLHTFECGAGGDTLTLAAAYVSGASTIQFADVGDLVVGDKIDLGVAQLNQRSKTILPFNAVRTVKAIDGDVVTINPIHVSGSLKNVNATGFAIADTMDVLGTKTVSYKCYPIYNKDAWGYENIKQPALSAVDTVSCDAIKGINTRFVSWSDGKTGETGQRAETLEIYFAIRSEFLGEILMKVGIVA